MKAIKFLLLGFLTLAVCMGYAQHDSVIVVGDSTVIDTVITNVPQSTGVTLPLITEWFDKLFPVVLTALINIVGMYSDKIPFLKNISDTGLRVITIAVLLGAGYVAFGGQIWEAAMSYLASILSYHTVIRPISRATSTKNYK